jgi:hypothetical protein
MSPTFKARDVPRNNNDHAQRDLFTQQSMDHPPEGREFPDWLRPKKISELAIEPPEMLLEGVACRGDKIAVQAASKSRKTWFGGKTYEFLRIHETKPPLELPSEEIRVSMPTLRLSESQIEVIQPILDRQKTGRIGCIAVANLGMDRASGEVVVELSIVPLNWPDAVRICRMIKNLSRPKLEKGCELFAN